mmetsp:Transcript_20/g.18  ORF Transcript_20/g.18 Transcript_20/m.18 type:complete len:84 (+) Transcript_20:195-446(+)
MQSLRTTEEDCRIESTEDRRSKESQLPYSPNATSSALARRHLPSPTTKKLYAQFRYHFVYNRRHLSQPIRLKKPLCDTFYRSL